MARRQALLRLHQRLVSRRDTLRKILAGELEDLGCTVTGDAADAAFDAGCDEISSQLAQLEARELNQIDRALSRMKQGTFGDCEGCGKKIPVTRLNALPYSPTCVQCQQEMERHGEWGTGDSSVWERVDDGSLEDRRVNLADIEVDAR